MPHFKNDEPTPPDGPPRDPVEAPPRRRDPNSPVPDPKPIDDPRPSKPKKIMQQRAPRSYQGDHYGRS